MSHRIDRVRSRLADVDAEALLITSLPNIRWGCGFTGSNGVLLVDAEDAHFVTDGRYIDQAQEEVGGAEVHITRGSLSKYLADQDLLSPYRRVAFQADSVTVARRDSLADQHESVQWVPVSQLLTHMVGQKDEGEVESIRASQVITESVFEEIIGWTEPGMMEREVAAEIVYRHLQKGADSMSFEPIVASGPNAARPHARPTDRRLQSGDLVVLDMGCFRDGYASDMTRTVAIGEPRAEARQVYELVQNAQEDALEAARSGLTGKELDAVARDVIEAAGFGDYFSHSLGHGLGLQVHEWPRVSYRSEEELPEGACVTIEPGVYIPEEDIGVRIEDIVVLHTEGSENLTSARKDLVVL